MKKSISHDPKAESRFSFDILHQSDLIGGTQSQNCDTAVESGWYSNRHY